MTDTPKRIWAFPKKDWFEAGASTSKITAVGAKDEEFHRADLSANLVRAALEAAANDAHNTGNKFLHDYFHDRAADREAVAAIVAQVMEKE